MAASKSDKPKAADKKVFDVAKPGKSAPDATGRPVIVGHKPMIQDPMVNTEEENPSDLSVAQEESVAPTRTAKKIAPLADKKSEEVEKPSKEAPAEPASEEVPSLETEKDPQTAEAFPEETKEEPVPAAETPNPEQETTQKPNTDDSAAVEALANQAAKKKEGDLNEEEKKRAEAINKLIEDKTYNVRVGQAHHQRNTRLIIILVVLALLVAGAAIAMDAGLIQSNIELPFDIIPN